MSLMKRFFHTLPVLLGLAFMLSSHLQAQISVRVQMEKKTFVSYEHVKAIVSITNRSGRPLRLASTRNRSWIEFDVKRNGKELTASRNSLHGTTIVNTGATVQSSFDLSQSFGLTTPANYSIKATVHVDEQSAAFRSNNSFFTVNKGLSIFRSRYGDPSDPSKIREYNVISSQDEKSYLYIQVREPLKDKILNTYQLGEYLRFRKPQFQVDRHNHLHTLFPFSPDLWAHIQIGPDGQVLGREYVKAADSTPGLATDRNGSVVVLGASKYDPAAAQKKRAEIHKLSERPRSVYN